MQELCSCGSGRAFARCHGDPRNAYAREQALLEARQLATFFPSVRLMSPPMLEYAEGVAATLGEKDEVTEELLDRGLRLVPEDEALRLVAGWATVYPDRWDSLVHTSAHEAAVVRAVSRGALEVAIHERSSTPRELFVELEVSQPAVGPALALVLPPHFVWSFDEARAAAAAVGGRGGELEERLLPLQEVADALLRVEHTRRVTHLASLIERELPRDGFPTASERLQEACVRVCADAQLALQVGTLVLVAYVRQLTPDSYITSLN